MKKKIVKKAIRIKYLITATTALGLENILADEIKNLGGKKIKIRARAVVFEGDRRLLYKSNICLRTAIRILKPILSFQFKTQDEFYFQIREFNWLSIFNSNQTFTIDSAVFSNIFSNSQYCTLKAKDGIVDRFRHDRNVRPNVDREEPDFRFHLHVHEQNCTISLDSSGTPLNQRGYRKTTGAAPINECLAAGMILWSGWDKKQPLVDAMCGSGTIATEAAMMLRNVAPGLIRSKYAFQKWFDYKKELYLDLVEESRNKMQASKPGLIYARDLDTRVIKYARENMRRAGVLDLIDLEKGDFMNAESAAKSGYLIMNPPYGERLRPGKIGKFYKNIGDSLEEHYSQFHVTIISSNEMALQCIGLNVQRELEIQNGPLKCKLQELNFNDE